MSEDHKVPRAIGRIAGTAGRDFAPGDEILVSSLDHHGGVAPWLELARDRGLVVRHVELHEDTTLDFADLEAKLGPRTRVVAFAWASNAVGTIMGRQQTLAAQPSKNQIRIRHRWPFAAPPSKRAGSAPALSGPTRNDPPRSNRAIELAARANSVNLKHGHRNGQIGDDRFIRRPRRTFDQRNIG